MQEYQPRRQILVRTRKEQIIMSVVNFIGEGREQKPVRGEGWFMSEEYHGFARSLGRDAARELIAYYNNDAYNGNIIADAAELASQEPPLSIRTSWEFYDGVLEAVRMAKVEGSTRRVQ